MLGTRVEGGDPAQRTITTTTRRHLRLRQAAARHGRRAAPAAATRRADVIYFRTLDDYERLRALADRKAEVIVIGGGFIGSEIAAALAMNGARATMVFPDAGIGVRVYPPSLSKFLSGYYREKGVTRAERGEDQQRSLPRAASTRWRQRAASASAPTPSSPASASSRS